MKNQRQATPRAVFVRACGTAVLLTCSWLPASFAWADQNQTNNAPEAAAADAYVGVAPGSDNKNPLPKPDVNPPKLVWTGFQPSEAGGRVFLQTTLPVTFEVKEGSKSLALTLRNCRVHLRNNERDLNTRFFDTPVAGIKTRQHKRDVQIVISLKTAMAATPHIEDGPDGTKFLVVDFPNAPKTAAN